MGTFLPSAALPITFSRQKMESSKMTNTERSTHPSSSNAYGYPGRSHPVDAPKDDLASKASVESVIADVGEKAQQALNYAGQKGQEAADNVREVGDTFAGAVDKSVTKRPYATLALAVGLGFLFGATWRR
jgi:ElaB/YqjD/DUF883 family membrane-anchored ribosome-binding protein